MNSDIHPVCQTRRWMPACLYLGFALTVISPSLSYADTVVLGASDTLGISSFNTGTNWNNGVQPIPGYDYFTGNFRLRTPIDGNSYTFGGDSLTINNTTGIDGGLTYKGTGTTGIITINNLILDGGSVNSLSAYSDLFQLAGNLTVTATGGTIQAKQTPINISAIISGIGPLTVAPSDNTGGNALTFSAMNTFTGNLVIQTNGNFILDGAGGLSFDINAGGFSNTISGTGLAAFNGTFTFDLTDAGMTEGDSWTLVSAATLTETYGDTFAIAGFTQTDNVWTSADGIYQFSEATGVLSVAPVPEPSTCALIAMGAFAFTGAALRRRKTA